MSIKYYSPVELILFHNWLNITGHSLIETMCWSSTYCTHASTAAKILEKETNQTRNQIALCWQYISIASVLKEVSFNCNWIVQNTIPLKSTRCPRPLWQHLPNQWPLPQKWRVASTWEHSSAGSLSVPHHPRPGNGVLILHWPVSRCYFLLNSLSAAVLLFEHHQQGCSSSRKQLSAIFSRAW